MKRSYIYLGLFFVLLHITAGCSSVYTTEDMLEKRPPDGRFTVLVFYEDISPELNQLREVTSRHFKIQKSEFRGGGADDKSDLYEVTTFPTILVIGHEGIILRTNDFEEAINFFED